MFGFIKKLFIAAIGSIELSSYSTLNSIPLMFVSVSNQECRLRSIILNVNSNEPLLWSNSLVVKALDPQSRGPMFKTTGWLQG